MALFATSASAQDVAIKEGGDVPAVNGIARKSISRVSCGSINTALEASGTSRSKASSNAGKAAMPDEMIVVTPAGKLSDMYRTVSGFYVDGSGNVSQASADGYYSQVVEGDKGEVYIKEAFGFASFGTWIKGQKNAEGNVVFKFPQLVAEYIDPYSGTVEHYYAQAMNRQGNTFTVATDNEVVFTWKDGMLKKTDSNVLLGATNADGGWTGFGDLEASLSVFTDEASAPANPNKASKYLISYKDHEDINAQGYVYAIQEGSDFFIENLNKNVKNGWIRGSVSGGKVTFKKQYIGIDTENEAYAYFIPVSITKKSDGNGGVELSYEPADNVTFDYDETSGVLSTTADFLVNQGRNYPAPITVYQSARLSPSTEEALTPAAPEIIQFQRATQSLDSPGYISFKLPSKTVDGSILDVKKMYFRMYFDNTLYTFEDFWYYGLEATPYAGKTDIPATFTDEDVLSEPDFLVEGDTHLVTVFNNARFKEIGIQSVYKSGGETKESEITYYDDGAAGIGHVGADLIGSVKSVAYYDLSGCRVTNPVSGVYIKSEKMADGTVRTSKFVVK